MMRSPLAIIADNQLSGPWSDHGSGDRVCGDAYSFHGSPLQVSAEILPDTLKPPDHCELAIGEVLEQAVDEEARDFAPVAVTAEGHFFEQHRADGKQRGKCIAEQ